MSEDEPNVVSFTLEGLIGHDRIDEEWYAGYMIWPSDSDEVKKAKREHNKAAQDAALKRIEDRSPKVTVSPVSGNG